MDMAASVTSRMPENTWHGTEYHLHILQARSGAHIETEWFIYIS